MADGTPDRADPGSAAESAAGSASRPGERGLRGWFSPAGALPEDERVVELLKPSVAWVFVRTPWRLTGLSVLAIGLVMWAPAIWMAGGTLLLLAMQLAWNALQLEARWYAVTADQAGRGRVVVVGGVLNRFSTEVPLTAVRGIVVVRPLLERLLGIGNVGFGSAATGSLEVVWLAIAEADAVAGRVRALLQGDGDAESGGV